MTDRALSSGSVRIRYEDDIRENTNEMRYNAKSLRNSAIKERENSAYKEEPQQETSRNRSFSANNSKEEAFDEPISANSVRRAAENSRRMSRTSPMGRLTRSEYSSIESRESMKQKSLPPVDKGLKRLGGMKRKKTLEILNNSTSSQERNSVRDSERYNGVKRPQTTRAEEESVCSDTSRRSADFALNSSKGKIGKKEITSLLFPSLGKNLNFKKQLIADSMTRLKNSEQTTAVVTRNNSVKSGLALEHDFGLKHVLTNTSLTFESGDFAKSSEDSFHAKDSKESKTSERLALKAESISSLEKAQAQGEQEPKRESYEQNTITHEKFSKDLPLKVADKVEEGQGTIIQLRELFKHNFSEGPIVDSMSKYGGKRGSYPTIATSSRNSFNASQIFRPSETESHIVNVSRLNEIDDHLDVHDKREEMRRYSMEMNIFGWNGENIGNIQEQDYIREEVLNSARGNNRQSVAVYANNAHPSLQTTPVKEKEKQQGPQIQSEMRRTLVPTPVIKEDSREETDRTNSFHSKVNSMSQGTPVFHPQMNESLSKEFLSSHSQFNSKTSLVGDKSAEEIKRKIQDRLSKEVPSSAGKVNVPISRESPQKVAYSTGKKLNNEDLTALMGVRKFTEGLEKELAKKLQSKPEESLNNSLLMKEKKKVTVSESLNNSRVSPQKEKSVSKVANEIQARISNHSSASKEKMKESFESRKKNSIVEEISEEERLRKDATDQLNDSVSQIRIKTFLVRK